jgi:orotate phosphoribosyltransferase
VPCGVVIALDRMERGQGELSAVQEVERNYGLPVVSVARLTDLIAYLAGNAELADHLPAVEDYRRTYGIAHAPAA